MSRYFCYKVNLNDLRKKQIVVTKVKLFFKIILKLYVKEIGLRGMFYVNVLVFNYIFDSY